MAALSTAWKVLRDREPLASQRLPVFVPPATDLPPAFEAVIGTSSPLSPRPVAAIPLTEVTLRQHYLCWLLRLRQLDARLHALSCAADQGLPSCWAGKTTAGHLRSVQRAVEEAKWVEGRLRLAVIFVKEEQIKKLPLRTLAAGARKKGCALFLPLPFSSSLGTYLLAPLSRPTLRPTHARFPPTLLDLPFPIPDAKEGNIYVLTCRRPAEEHDQRPQERDEEREAQRREAPPYYTEEADVFGGETTMERSEMTSEEEYARALMSVMEDFGMGQAPETTTVTV